MGANGVGASGGNRNLVLLILSGNGASATVLFAEHERRVTQRVRHGCEFQATKNPSTLNQNGGVDGLHKMGDIKEKQWQ